MQIFTKSNNTFFEQKTTDPQSEIYSGKTHFFNCYFHFLARDIGTFEEVVFEVVDYESAGQVRNRVSSIHGEVEKRRRRESLSINDEHNNVIEAGMDSPTIRARRAVNVSNHSNLYLPILTV